MKDKQGNKLFPKRSRTLSIAVILIILLSGTAYVYIGNSGQARPMVAYLFPFKNGIPDIWLASLDDPTQAEPLTHTPLGVHDFSVSENGRYIAYSASDEQTGARDIFLLEIETGATRQITFCGDEAAECYSPVFHPASTVIAYVRLSDEGVDPDEGDSSNEARRPHSNIENIWLLDLEDGTSRPLANDSHFAGHSPQWSPDGNSLAFYKPDAVNPGIVVYNFNPVDDRPRTQYPVQSFNGLVGSLAPSGLRLVFPDMINREGQVISYLRLADFDGETPQFTYLTDPDDPVDDINVGWYPDGKTITISRRYTDSHWTRGYQLYQMNVESRETTRLLYDENYSHHYFEWDKRGDYLLVQRLAVGVSNNISPDSLPEIWVMDYNSHELSRIAEGAYHPRWVNQ